VNKFKVLESLVEDAKRKVERLRGLGVDKREPLRAKWIVMEKTVKVIQHKVAVVKAQGDQHAVEAALERAIKGAELLNLQLDDLLATATTKNGKK
jgi:hypothetical protein